MTPPPRQGKNLLFPALLVLLLMLFLFVFLRTGPMAPVPVTAITVERHELHPALFGIGTVEARRVHRVGPTLTGRLLALEVDTGDRVRQGQLLGEMDPVDLGERINALRAARERAEAGESLARARRREGELRRDHAQAQAQRHERLRRSRSVSDEVAEGKQYEARAAEAQVAVADADLEAARREMLRLDAEIAGLFRQEANLRLLSPIDGLVSLREADPGSTVTAGQPVVEIIDPVTLWLHVRFDQQLAAGLRPGLPTRIVLRSRAGETLEGRVVRVEPRADAVTEELLAKVDFTPPPASPPSVGELAEVTVMLPPAAALPVVPNAALHRRDGRLGVWSVADGRARFLPVHTGAHDLDGQVQIVAGLEPGARVVAHSQRPLAPGSRLRLVENQPGSTR